MKIPAVIPTTLILITALQGLPARAQSSPPVVQQRPVQRRRRHIFIPPPPPPNLGAPSRRAAGAGSRGCGEGEQGAIANEPLTALVPFFDEANVPSQAFSKTSAERPTLWVYVPYQPPEFARFVLLNSAEKSIYETKVQLPNAPGVMGISLPDTVPPLAPGETYHWFFNVYCQSPPPLAFIDGHIQRDALPAATAAQLAQMSPQDQIDFYTRNGFWHDALAIAAALHESDPADTSWRDLLQDVGLGDFATEAIAAF